jgi:F-type H+-transporting ATPase subunit delta
MPNPRLAGRYAKSLIDLSKERGELEVVYADMKYLKAICKASRDFVNVLISPVITATKKQSIFNEVTKGSVSNLTNLFSKLLIDKGREGDLPEIVTAFIEQYNEIKGIHVVKLTTAVEIGEDLKKTIESKVQDTQKFGSVELETKVNTSLIGGFVLEFNNNLVDKSILRDLNDIKKQFAQNVYVLNIR